MKSLHIKETSASDALRETADFSDELKSVDGELAHQVLRRVLRKRAVALLALCDDGNFTTVSGKAIQLAAYTCSMIDGFEVHEFDEGQYHMSDKDRALLTTINN